MTITVPAQCARITWNFNLSQGGVATEVAEFSMAARMRTPVGNAEPPAPFSDTALAAFCQPLADAAYDGWAARFVATDFPTSLILDSVRAAFNDGAGLTIAEAYGVGSGDKWQGSHSGSLPWSDSLCISTYGFAPGTFNSQARSKRGRSYLPPFAPSIIGSNEGGQISSTAVSFYLTCWDQMWEDIRAATYPLVSGTAYAPVPGVVSPTKHYFTDAAYWRADGIIDTQRRRRNREAGAYQQLAVLSSTP